MSAMPPTAPRMIYVRDFDLKPGIFQAESGILPISPISASGTWRVYYTANFGSARGQWRPRA